MTIKSTITKRTISGKISGWNNKKIYRKRNKIGERERERERVLTSFVVDNLEGIEEGGNEIIRNVSEN